MAAPVVPEDFRVLRSDLAGRIILRSGLADFVVAEGVADDLQHVALGVVLGLFDHLLVAGEVLVVDQVFRFRRFVPGAVGL